MLCPRYAVAMATALVFGLASQAMAASKTYAIRIQAGKHDRQNTVVKVPLVLPEGLKASGVALTAADGKPLAGQLTGLGVHSPGPKEKATNQAVLHFVLPSLKAGQTATFKAIVSSDAAPAAPSFAWHDTAGEYAELTFGDSPARPVMRYMYRKLDDSSKEAREQTYKVFHHLYDPAGKQLVTKGPGGQYTHHRGLFFGFNKVTYDGNKKTDIWHCTNDAHQSHEGFTASETGPVLGRHRLAIDWHGAGKEVYAKEDRELAAYNVPGGVLIEFASRVRTVGGPIQLDGDPQHAGFHFRAAQEVAEKTKGQTYYLRPDGKGKPGETRNWDPKSKMGPVNLPWNAMSFVGGGQRYTAVYLDNPANPKEARGSERDYGRFGTYFEYEITPDRPLAVSYRIWLQAGELKPEQPLALSADFTEPVGVEVE